MGNITGTLIENAFQPQPSTRPPLDLQEEIKKLARDSSNRELYRLLHAEMEHGVKERTSAGLTIPVTVTPDSDDVRRGAEKPEAMRRSSGEFQSHVLNNFASSKYRGGLQPTAERSQSRDKDSSGENGNLVGLDSSEEKKMASDQEEPFSMPRLAFKKKLLNSYRTENEEASTKTENSTVVNREKEIKAEPHVYAEPAGKSNASEVGSVPSDGAQKPLTRVLNFDNCIQVIVMNELQKLESVPDELQGSKKLQLFGMLEMEAQKSKSSEVFSNETSKDRGSTESNWPPRIEKNAIDAEPKRDRWPQYGRLDPASSRAASEMSPHRAATRMADVSQSLVPMGNMASAYRAVGHLLEASAGNQDLTRMYSSGPSDGSGRNFRQMVNLAGENASGEVGMSHGPPLMKHLHPGIWGHGQDIAVASSSPHLLPAESGYRAVPSNQMVHQMVDHRRKVEKEPESAKLQRAEYVSYSGPSQYPLIPGQPPHHSSYQTSSPMLPDKHHNMDVTSYLYPGKASRERIHCQYEPSYVNQSDGLQPSVVSYLKHSPKNSPIMAYEKELPRPSLGEPQYNRPEMTKTSPGGGSAGSIRSYRPVTNPHIGYRGERPPGRPDIQLDKRTYGLQNAAEDFEFEKHFRRMATNNRDVPMGSEQPIPRSISSSFLPIGRVNLERGVAGPAEETPLDLTIKRDVGNIHQSSVYLLPSGGVKQHQTEWEIEKLVGYKPSYVREEDQVHANVFRHASQKGADFIVPEQVQRREVLDTRQVYDKVPPGLTLVPSESDFGRIIPTPVQERNMRTSVIASHPFDDTASNLGPPSHLTMQQMSEALMKTQMHPVNNWKQSAYQEILPQSRALTLDTESSFRTGSERMRPRPNNPSSDLLHFTTTSPTIPHLSPIQPLTTPIASQAPGGRRISGPSLLGSHSPSDILHLQCKVCGSTYGSLRSFRMHFAKVHGLEPLPEHCNISTISGTKNAMSKVVQIDDNEPPSLQRETLPSDVSSSGKNRAFSFDQFTNSPRCIKSDIVRTEVPAVNTRTKQVAEVYPMPVRVTRGLSPQQKPDPLACSGRRPDINDAQMEPNETKMRTANEMKSSGLIVNCDIGILRSRNCYNDPGCDVDCPECLDGFKDISDWKMHISTHMMRSCTCKACNLSFTHSGALRKHLQTVHTPLEKVDVEYRCLFCREVFSDEKILFQHTQGHEKKYSRVDNARRDSGSLHGSKQHGWSMDSECIQMAIPDTTSSDDVRPTSGFGENSSNVSPSTDFKGSFDKKSFADLMASGQSNIEPGNVQRSVEIKTEDDRTCKVGLTDQYGKMWTKLQRSEAYGSGCDSGQNRSDTIQLSKSPGSASHVRSDSSDVEKEYKPTKASDESNAFVSKKQAFLKRFKSTEERESTEGEPSHLSSSVQQNSNGTHSVGRTSNAEVQQPIHLKDLFSMIGHQVEKSIRGISDFPPLSSFVPAQRSRCVRDVCDEIIAQSFRKDKNPKESVSSVSVLESLELNPNDKVKEQLKNMLILEPAIQTSDMPRSRSGAEASYGQGSGWMGSPCSSRDSYHSLEIDESEFNKERSGEDYTEGGHVECTDVEKANVTSESSRQESEQKETSDSRKYSGRSDNRLPVDQNFRALESEIGGVQVEYYFNRQGNLEGARSENSGSRAASASLKESCSPTSTQKLEICNENDGSSSLSSKLKPSDRVPTPCQKRKHSISDASSSKDASDIDDNNEPPMKKPAS